MENNVHPPLRIALIGAGVFARDAHVPSLLRHPDRFTLVAIHSRSHASAAALAESIPHAVDISTDLDALLARPDIDAVDIVLPIGAMPAAVEHALASGKHVLSEKPIAPDMAAGRALVARYAARSDGGGQVWMVGENWRYEEAYLRAGDLVQNGAIGTPVTCHWVAHFPMTPNSKYYHTLWRRDSSIPGGLILDGGVHYAAVLRHILGEIVEISATATQVSPELQPIDTLAATLRFAGGAVGAYVVTYATAAPWPAALHISGTDGALRIMRDRIELTRGGTSETIACQGFDGVEKEMLAFVDSIQTGAAHANTPDAALADLAVVEAMLVAAAQRTPVNPTAL